MISVLTLWHSECLGWLWGHSGLFLGGCCWDAGHGSFQGFVGKITRGEKALLQEKPQREMEWKEGEDSPRRVLEIFLAGGFEGSELSNLQPSPVVGWNISACGEKRLRKDALMAASDLKTKYSLNCCPHKENIPELCWNLLREDALNFIQAQSLHLQTFGDYFYLLSTIKYSSALLYFPTNKICWWLLLGIIHGEFLRGCF